MAKKPEEKDARLGGERPRGGLPPELQKKKQDSKNFQRLFNLLILGFIGYGFFVYLQEGGEAGVLNDLGTQLAVIDAEPEGDPRIDRLDARNLQPDSLSYLYPVERPSVRSQTLQEGAGLPVECAQEITYRLIEGFGSEQSVSETRRMRLGSPTVPQGLTLGMEGMKPGEVRRIEIPQQLWTGSAPAQEVPVEITALTVELESVGETLPQTTMPLRRFIRKASNGDALRCGDLAIVEMTIWAGNGEQLFTTAGDQPVYFFLGDGRVPYGIERGVQDLRAGGAYSLVVAPQYWPALQQESAPLQPIPYAAQPFPQDLAVPEGQLVLVDIGYPEELPPLKQAVIPATAPKNPTGPLPAATEAGSEPVSAPDITNQPQAKTKKDTD